MNKSENKVKTESAQSKESCTIFGTGFSDVTRGSGVWPESRVGCGATLKNFFDHFFRLNASGRNAIVQSRYKSSDSIALSFFAKVVSICAKVWHK